MRLASLILAVALSFPVLASEPSATVALEVPGTQYRSHDTTLPPPDQEVFPPVWDDTADVYDELEEDLKETEDEVELTTDDEVELEVQPEVDLNNDVTDPLLESAPENEPPLEAVPSLEDHDHG